jgi:hypothetical protein
MPADSSRASKVPARVIAIDTHHADLNLFVQVEDQAGLVFAVGVVQDEEGMFLLHVQQVLGQVGAWGRAEQALAGGRWLGGPWAGLVLGLA